MKSKPIKPYENFQDYLQKNWSVSSVKATIKNRYVITYRCSNCQGRKTVVAPGEFCDPVEHYKMAKRVPCLECKGTGTQSLSKTKKQYLTIIHKWEKEVKMWNEYKLLYDSAVKKLTEKERKVLGIT